MTAIRHKAARYSREVKRATMLMLDGQRDIAFDTPPVLHEFTRSHLDEARTSGFDDIFLLGTTLFMNLLQPQEDNVWFSA